LVQRVTQQLVQVLHQPKFLQRLLQLHRFSLLQLFLLELSSQQLFSQLSLLAFRRHLLQWFSSAQLSSRLSLLALALQVEHRASDHRVQHAHELGRLVDR
jgi:hypothetical protein